MNLPSTLVSLCPVAGVRTLGNYFWVFNVMTKFIEKILTIGYNLKVVFSLNVLIKIYM